MPSFTRTLGGTVTTFLPKEPPGTAPKPTHQSGNPSFAPEAAEPSFANSFSSPTTDLPAGVWSVGAPLSGLEFDELATDVLPAGGLSIVRPPADSPSQPDLEPQRSNAGSDDDRYESDAELDELLADLSAVVSPFLPTDDLPETPPAAPAVQPVVPNPAVSRPAVPRPNLEKPSFEQPSVPRPNLERPSVERLTDYPSPRPARAESILGDGPKGTPVVRRMQARPPVANLPLGPARDFDHPMDGPVGGWVRLIALLVAAGLTAGAISYALMA